MVNVKTLHNLSSEDLGKIQAIIGLFELLE